MFGVTNYKTQSHTSMKHFYETFPDFDWSFYIHYNDLASNQINSPISALEHYWKYGQYEGRRICKIIKTSPELIQIPTNHLFTNIKQCHVSSGLQMFKERFMNTFQFTHCKDNNEPCIFFGLYSDGDLKVLKNHNGLKYIIWGGEDINPLQNHCKFTVEEVLRLHNVIHLAISNCIYKRLKLFNIPSIFIEFNLVDQSLFSPIQNNEHGKKIMIFNGQTQGREHIYGKHIYEQVTKQLPQYEFILSNTLNVSYDEMPKIYKQCFVMLRLTKYDGNANSVQECQSMKIPVIHNQSDYGLKWNNINDIIQHINNLFTLVKQQECSDDSTPN
jgi:hypothetical protein